MYFKNTITNFKKVKMTVDKDFTTVNAVSKVKEEWREFQEQMSMDEIIRDFVKACRDNGIKVPYGHFDCILCDVEGFADHYWPSHFRFNMILTNHTHRMIACSFYFDVGEGINADKVLLDAESFERVEDEKKEEVIA